MGDIGAEPSMEEILSSIKRIIAEEGDGTNGRRRGSRAAERPVQTPAPRSGSSAAYEPEPAGNDEVLELSDPICAAEPSMEQPAPTSEEEPSPEPVCATVPQMAQPAAPAGVPAPEPILSASAMDATRGALESLSRLMVKPEPQSDGTLEGLVRDMLRPMLREWLDAHLPAMVEAMVAKEIARISGQQR